VEIKITFCLPRDAASAPVSRQLLDACLDVLGVSPETRTDIALAMGEACANVIQHACAGDEYEVRAGVVDGRCVIEVVNAGPGMKAAPVGDPGPGAEHGRGLQIIDAVAENLRLTGRSQAGTTLHFEKVLRWLPDAAGGLLFGDLTAPPAASRPGPASPGGTGPRS